MKLCLVEQAASDEEGFFVRVMSVWLLETTHPVTCKSNLVVGNDECGTSRASCLERTTQASDFIWKFDSTWKIGTT